MTISGLTNRSAAEYGTELRVPPNLVLLALLTLNCLLVMVSQSFAWEVADRVMSLFLSVCVLAAISWLCLRWAPLAGRWLTALTLLASVNLFAIGLGIPGIMTLAAVPVALTTSLLSFPAALLTAAMQSLVLLVLQRYPDVGLDSSTVAVALIATWAILGVTYVVYLPVRQMGRWLDKHLNAVQNTLEEARDQKVELERTLQSLKQANRQLLMANERMAVLRSIAEDAQKTKTMFVAKVSHEFRTPLNMIIGLIELMVENSEIYTVQLPPEMEQDLEVVLRNCRHLSSMIDDVLDLARVETGQMILHREWISLADIIEEAVAEVLPLVEKKGLNLQVTIPDNLPVVYCDRARIRQVMLNLVSNAARFTEKGRITIKVEQWEQRILVSVQDTGPGIPPGDMARIFEPFSQGSSDLWRDRKGSGLGLSISKEFIELHNGHIWVESELGVGTTFFFTLPVSVPIEHTARPERWIRTDWVWQEHAFIAGRAGVADLERRPHLVIYDETERLGAEFARYLREIDLTQVTDVNELGQAVQDYPADAVVLNLPLLSDLLRLVEELRQRMPDTPIVGCSLPQLAKRATDAGALGYLTKPVTRADLAEAIERIGSPVRRVLVVDDDPDTLSLFTRMLHACDDTLEIVTAASGAQALEELRRATPDLALLDIVLPDMEGWQVLAAMGQDARLGSVPTFFVSAKDPAAGPVESRILLATIGDGLSIKRLLRCTMELSRLLLTPEGELDPMPAQIAGAG